jgi:hypothetical protein
MGAVDEHSVSASDLPSHFWVLGPETVPIRGPWTIPTLRSWTIPYDR